MQRASPLIAAAAVVLTLAAPVAPARSLAAQLAEVRAVTAPYHRIDAALDDQYGEFHVCVEVPGQGAMGQHYVNLGLVVDKKIDPLFPEALVYEPGPDGQFRLVAVEYVVFAADWHASNSSAPSLFGQTFHFVDRPNRYDFDPFYALHEWLWRHNPNGMFEDLNPRVRCP